MGNFYQQNRSLLLLMLSILLLFVAYFAGIKKSVTEYGEVSALRKQLQVLDNLDARIAAAKSKFSDVMVKGFSSEAEKNSYLIDSLLVLEKSEGVSLVEIAPGSFTKKDMPTVEFLSVTLSGSYASILKAVMFFERSKGLGVVSSVSFYTKVEQRTKRLDLFCRVLLQNVKK